MSGRGPARAGARDQRLDSHHAHKSPHAFAVDAAPFFVERERHPPRAVERQFQISFVATAWVERYAFIWASGTDSAHTMISWSSTDERMIAVAHDA